MLKLHHADESTVGPGPDLVEAILAKSIGQLVDAMCRKFNM
jgi:hypothetical protein